MTGAPRVLNWAGARALILHRPHPGLAALERQLAAIGLTARRAWPEVPGETPAQMAADVLFFDVDMGFDAQFPWPPGRSPMPMIALIGSEVPGRIEWSLSRGAHAHLLKPVGDGGVYAALLIARATFEAQARAAAETAAMRARLAARETVVRAAFALTAQGLSQAEALAHLRRLATDRRETIEAAAERLLDRGVVPRRHGGGP